MPLFELGFGLENIELKFCKNLEDVSGLRQCHKLKTVLIKRCEKVVNVCSYVPMDCSVISNNYDDIMFLVSDSLIFRP